MSTASPRRNRESEGFDARDLIQEARPRASLLRDLHQPKRQPEFRDLAQVVESYVRGGFSLDEPLAFFGVKRFFELERGDASGHVRDLLVRAGDAQLAASDEEQGRVRDRRRQLCVEIRHALEHREEAGKAGETESRTKAEVYAEELIFTGGPAAIPAWERWAFDLATGEGGRRLQLRGAVSLAYTGARRSAGESELFNAITEEQVAHRHMKTLRRLWQAAPAGVRGAEG